MKRKNSYLISVEEELMSDTSICENKRSSFVSTPETARMVEICKEMERDYLKLAKRQEEAIIYKDKYEIILQENKKLAEKVGDLERIIIEKEREIKYLNVDNKFPYDPVRSEIIKSEHFANISLLRKTILLLKAENKRYMQNSVDSDILKDKLNTAESIIRSQERQIEIYQEKLEEMSNRTPNKLDIQKQSEYVKVANELHNIKSENLTLENKIYKMELNNNELTEVIKTLQESLDNIKGNFKVKIREIETLKSQLSRAVNVQNGYREILDSYSSLSFDDIDLEIILKQRIQKLESLCLGLGDECTKLEIANSILITNEDKDDLKNIQSCQKCRCATIEIFNNKNQTEEMQNHILHLSENPQTIYERTITKKYNDLLKQNESILTSIRILGQELKSNSVVNQNIVFNKVLQILNKLYSASDFDKIQEDANKYKTLASRYKQACVEKINSIRHDCTKLLGYGFEYNNNTIKLISIYSKTPDQHLIFKKLQDGKSFELISNDFSNSITPELEQYKDFPILNSAINLKLIAE